MKKYQCKELILLLEWLEQTWGLWLVIVALVEGLREVITGTGKFGKWMQARIVADVKRNVGEIERSMQSFMSTHSGCKESTERKLADLDGRVESCEERIGRDWESWKLQFRIDDALLEHVKHGNHMQECSDLKEELHEHLLNNR